ncbi:hypothetical protein TKK_0011318 [Trichogramma kaykai]
MPDSPRSPTESEVAAASRPTPSIVTRRRGAVTKRENPYVRGRRGRPPSDFSRRAVANIDSSSYAKFRCPSCPSRFSYLRGLQQHVKYACHKRPRFQCPYCPHRSKYRYAAYNHVRQMHKGENVYCLDIKEGEDE